MRCYTADGTGLNSLRFEDLPPPGEPGWGEVVVDVRAVSLNFRDLLVVKGLSGGRADGRAVVCTDMAGVVVNIGPGVNHLHFGDRVINAPFRNWPAGSLQRVWAQSFAGRPGVDGVLAERIVYPAESLVHCPDHLSFPQAATLPIAGLTAWAALVTHGKVKPGDWILLHGTGGVSIFCAQLAKILGARTILRTSTDEKARLARDLFSVTETMDYGYQDWAKRVVEITGGRGADVVVEVGGGSSLRDSIRACGYNGKVFVVGALGGPEGPINVMDLILRQISVRGIFMESAAELNDFSRAVQASKLVPYVDKVFPFEDARKAFDYLESKKHIGKVVIQVHDL